ncbi:hypothetical protein PGT21_032792 [Puccinia graminis f. sp. tritici]|uniref:Uncharacterized protein n=1 Tax=Puccinia graminis f. sp. tritici TaxID=56615 RepID=A0A5B0MXM9_PUCGR|nr:hypothetical protein PGT21_032792 [Puccinia graminis f. sp. tritici]
MWTKQWSSYCAMLLMNDFRRELEGSVVVYPKKVLPTEPTLAKPDDQAGKFEPVDDVEMETLPTEPTLAKPDDRAGEFEQVDDVEMETSPTEQTLAKPDDRAGKFEPADDVEMETLPTEPNVATSSLHPKPAPSQKPDDKIGAEHNHSALDLSKRHKLRPRFWPEETQVIVDFVASEPAGPLEPSFWEHVATLINQKFKTINKCERAAKRCRIHYNFVRSWGP